MADLDRLLLAACAGALLGGGLQFLVQLPAVAREIRGFRISWSWRDSRVREAIAAFAPAVGGRGVLQLSSYLDQVLASLLAPGAVAALQYGQQLYLLPIGLLPVSLAAASLPQLSAKVTGAAGSGPGACWPTSSRSASSALPAAGRLPRLRGARRRSALPDWELRRQGGAAGRRGARRLRARAARGLSGRCRAASTPAADTRRPAAIAAARVVVGTAVALPGDGRARPIGDRRGGSLSSSIFGAAGLALGSAAGSWLEFGALWRRLRVLELLLRMPWSDLARSLLLAVVSAALGWLVGWLLPAGTPVAVKAAVLGLFGLTYVGGALAWGVPEEGIRRRLHLRRR